MSHRILAELEDLLLVALRHDPRRVRELPPLFSETSFHDEENRSVFQKIRDGHGIFIWPDGDEHAELPGNPMDPQSWRDAAEILSVAGAMRHALQGASTVASVAKRWLKLPDVKRLRQSVAVLRRAAEPINDLYLGDDALGIRRRTASVILTHEHGRNVLPNAVSALLLEDLADERRLPHFLEGVTRSLGVLVVSHGIGVEHTDVLRSLIISATDAGRPAILVHAPGDPSDCNGIPFTAEAHVDNHEVLSDLVGVLASLLALPPEGDLPWREPIDATPGKKLRWLRGDSRPKALSRSLSPLLTRGAVAWLGVRATSEDGLGLRGLEGIPIGVKALSVKPDAGHCDVIVLEHRPDDAGNSAGSEHVKVSGPELLPRDPRRYSASLYSFEHASRAANAIAALHLSHGNWAITDKLIGTSAEDESIMFFGGSCQTPIESNAHRWRILAAEVLSLLGDPHEGDHARIAPVDVEKTHRDFLKDAAAQAGASEGWVRERLQPHTERDLERP